MIFLGFFLYHTLAGRSHAFYYTQYARDVTDVDKFMQVDDPVKYRDWLEYRFLPGMHWNSVGRSAGGTPSIILVGPPRIRAIRAKSAFEGSQPHLGSEKAHATNCGHAAEMVDMPVMCFDLTPGEMENEGNMSWFETSIRSGDMTNDAFWDLPPPPPHTKTGTCSGTATASITAGTYTGTDCALAYAAVTTTIAKKSNCPAGCVFSQDVWIEYKTGEEINEKVYSSYSGISYPSGGYVVQNMQELFKSPPSVPALGGELFPR